MQKAKIFTVLDIRWGYNNLRMKEGDEWKAVFSTNKGLFELLVMFFGLCNSPATFQRMIDVVFHDVIKTRHVMAYIDDILITVETVEELQGYTKRVLGIMKKRGLLCKPVKCQIEWTTIKFLGHYLMVGKLSTNPRKISAINDWPTL